MDFIFWSDEKNIPFSRSSSGFRLTVSISAYHPPNLQCFHFNDRLLSRLIRKLLKKKVQNYNEFILEILTYIPKPIEEHHLNAPFEMVESSLFDSKF